MTFDDILQLAIEAMPLPALSAADQGHAYGVLSLALRVLARDYEADLAAADEEVQAAKQLLAEEIEKRYAWEAKHTALTLRLRDVLIALEAMTAERDELRNRIDNLNAENARLHRSMEQWMSAAQHAQALPPGGVKVK